MGTHGLQSVLGGGSPALAAYVGIVIPVIWVFVGWIVVKAWREDAA